LAVYFKKVIKMDLLPSNTGKKITVNNKSIALFKKDGKVYAIQNRCPHQGADIADGFVKDGKAVCPLHGWAFDAETGAFIGNENTIIPTYQTKVEGNDIYILIDDE